MSIKQDAVIGHAVLIQGNPKVIAHEENTTETEIFFRIRRVDIMENKELTTDTPLPTARKAVDVRSMTLPGHLSDLHKRATKDRAQ